jgi:hypothetical protein
VNPTSGSDAMYSNEKRAKKHWHNILYALSITGDNSSSQEITDEVNKKVRMEVEYEFDPSRPEQMDKSRTQLDNDRKQELDFRKLSRKTTDKYLKRMVKKGWIKTKNHGYSLTPEGRNEKIFGEYYGSFLYDRLTEMPFKGTLGEKLEEYVKWVGIYITYVFMRNSNRAGIESQYASVRKDYDEWVNDAISPVILLEWFNNVFYSKSNSNNYDKLANTLNNRFKEYIKNLDSSDKMYYDKILPSLYRNSLTMLKKREEARLDYT